MRRAGVVALAMLLAGCVMQFPAPDTLPKPQAPVSTPPPPPPGATAPAPPPAAAGGGYRNVYTQDKDSAPVNARDVDFNSIPDALPRDEPRGKYGNKSPYTVLGKTYTVLTDARGFREQGTASWYGEKFQGFRTSSMETYDMYAMTAAHKTLPIPTYVRVTNLDNQRAVIVRVNDRGPFKDGRIIDLSWAAANKLGYAANGTARVAIEVVAPGTGGTTTAGAADAGAGTFFVQVGAFALESSARQLAETVRGLVGDTVSIARGDDVPAPLHRVRVGPYAARTDAERIRDLLRNAGLDAALALPAP